MQDPSSTAMELIVGKIMYEAIKHGDYSRVNALWDRSIGKVTEKIQHQLPPPTVIRMIDDDGQPTNERVVMGLIPPKDEE